jgi:hypothetical protein
MDGATSLRKEMQDIIDSIPEYNLYRLRPLLDALVETDPDDLLSDTEEQLFEQCRNDRRERPETFTPWRKVRRGHEIDDLEKEPPYTVETDLTQEEIAMCEAGTKEYREHPETLITGEQAKRGKQ